MAIMTRKPIPKTAARWRKELDGWIRFVASMVAIADPEDPNWHAKMLAYARARIADLEANPPAPPPRPKRTVKSKARPRGHSGH